MNLIKKPCILLVPYIHVRQNPGNRYKIVSVTDSRITGLCKWNVEKVPSINTVQSVETCLVKKDEITRMSYDVRLPQIVGISYLIVQLGLVIHRL